MIFFILSFLAPLTGLMALTMSLSAHWMHSAYEQIRLDATTLSLCHSQLNFYESQIKPLNLRIRTIQIQMAAEAASCALIPANCSRVFLVLKRLQNQGLKIMKLQDQLRKVQTTTQRVRLLKLRKANNLETGWGGSLPSTDGLTREGLNADLSQESLQGFSPPLALVPGQDFDSLNELRFGFTPRRTFLEEGSGRLAIKQQPLVLGQRLESVCRVDWDGGVQRLGDRGDPDIEI